MFWKKKPALPVTYDDKLWVDECIDYLITEFGEHHFRSLKTKTPTTNFYNRIFDGSEADAIFILERTKELMDVTADIELVFYDDSPVKMEDGTLLSSPATGIDGSWQSASGVYEIDDNNKKYIYIEINGLKNTVGLVATMAHELAHEKLLGEARIEENDEYLTDLTAIYFGYGIFTGNSRFSFNTFRTNFGSGWQSSAKGYLPEQIIAYATARLSFLKKEPVDYAVFFTPTIKKYFDQSYKYLTEAEV